MILELLVMAVLLGGVLGLLLGYTFFNPYRALLIAVVLKLLITNIEFAFRIFGTIVSIITLLLICIAAAGVVSGFGDRTDPTPVTDSRPTPAQSTSTTDTSMDEQYDTKRDLDLGFLKDK